MNEAGTAEGITPQALAALARAWKELEEIKRKIKGKADPKPVDTSAIAAQNRRRHRQGQNLSDPVEPIVLAKANGR